MLWLQVYGLVVLKGSVSNFQDGFETLLGRLGLLSVLEVGYGLDLEDIALVKMFATH